MNLKVGEVVSLHKDRSKPWYRIVNSAYNRSVYASYRVRDLHSKRQGFITKDSNFYIIDLTKLEKIIYGI